MKEKGRYALILVLLVFFFLQLAMTWGSFMGGDSDASFLFGLFELAELAVTGYFVYHLLKTPSEEYYRNYYERIYGALLDAKESQDKEKF